MQVESVAWVAERKTVLAALLGLLDAAGLPLAPRPTRGPVLRARRGPVRRSGCSPSRCWSSCPCSCCCSTGGPSGASAAAGSAPGEPAALILEKAPLFALALLSGIVTIAAQSRVGAVASLQFFPLPVRLGNALLSCVAYLGDLFLPRDLTAFYPHPSDSLPWGRAGLAALALAGVTFVALRSRRAAPYAAFGWLWYLVTLLPVIGIIQVGSQARADRYLYLPLVGIFLAVVWGAADLARRRAALPGPGGALDRGGRRSARPGRPPAGGALAGQRDLVGARAGGGPDVRDGALPAERALQGSRPYSRTRPTCSGGWCSSTRDTSARSTTSASPAISSGRNRRPCSRTTGRSWPSTRRTPRPCRTTAIC